MGVYNVHVYVKLMGVYMCACRCKSMCIVIMGMYNVHVHVIIMGSYM